MSKLLELALEIFFFYLLYKLVVDFIIPVYRSTRQIRRHMQDAQQRMRDYQQSQQQQSQQPHQYTSQPPVSQEKGRNTEGEYIEYEEIK